MRPLPLAVLAAVLAAPAAAQPDDVAGHGPNPVAATPAEARLDALAQRERMLAASPLAEVPFRSVGPTVMSGRVTAVEGKPGDPRHVYVGYASGGVWRTANGGARFEPVSDGLPLNTVGDLAVDWRDPEGDGPTVWLGTGESNSSRSSYAGTGVYKSTDGGGTWAHLGLDESHHVGRVALHPTDPDVAWVAALGHLYSPNGERGLYRTQDGGATWERVLFVDDDTGAVDVVLDPNNPQRLWAATWTRSRRAWDFREAGPGSAVWGSEDGGLTWTRLSTEGSGFPTGALVGRIGLDAHPSGVLTAVVDSQERRPAEALETPTLTREQIEAMSREAFLELAEDDLNAFLDANNVPFSYTAESVLADVAEGRIEPADLVAFLADANRQLFDTPVVGAEVYRSTDGGRTWDRTHDGFLDDLFYSYGYYFGVVRVDPHDANRLFVLGVPLVGSVDGGATWHRADAAHVHVDHHDLWFDPERPGAMVSGNDGGLNATGDGGATWTKLNTPNVGQFYTVAVDEAEPYNVYGGLQDNGVWVGPSTYRDSPRWRAEGAYPYRRLMGGDGMHVQVDGRDGTVYTGFQFGNYFRTHRDGGDADRIVPRHELGERPFRFNWQTPIWLSRHVPDVLYLASHRVHRSLDRGETWAELSGDLTAGGLPGDVPFGTATSLHESPHEFGRLAVGTDDGRVWTSDDGGRTFLDRSSGLPDDLWVSRVEWSAHDADRLLVALNGYRWDHFDAYVYASDDAGRTWTRLGAGPDGALPAEPVNVAREDPHNPDALYVGTDGGLYVSLDRGATFTAFHGQRAAPPDPDGPFARPDPAFGPRLPHAPVHDLVVHARDRDLVVGTHGRSIWIASLGLVSQLSPEVMASRLHVFAPDTTRHRTDWGTRGYTWSSPPEPEVEVGYWTTASGEATVRVLDAEGEPVREWSDPAEPGLNLLTYDLRADVALEDDQEPGEDTGAFYLVPGAYTVEVTLGGEVHTAPLAVEPGPEPPSRARKKTP